MVRRTFEILNVVNSLVFFLVSYHLLKSFEKDADVPLLAISLTLLVAYIIRLTPSLLSTAN
jgi:hypothetical protein